MSATCDICGWPTPRPTLNLCSLHDANPYARRPTNAVAQYCSEPDCYRAPRGRGMCHKHWLRTRRREQAAARRAALTPTPRPDRTEAPSAEMAEEGMTSPQAVSKSSASPNRIHGPSDGA